MDEIIVTGDDIIELVAAEPEVELVALESDADQEIIFVGDAGIQGAPGKGIPTGGEVGQYLKKASGNDYDTEWVSTTGADSHYTAEFTPTANLTVTHNLGKYPAVTVINSAGDEVHVEVDYVNLNQVALSFGAAFGGRVICN